RVIRAGGVEPEEAPLPENRAVLREALDAGVVQVRGAMDGGAGVGLAEHERVDAVGLGERALGQALGPLRALLAKDPEPGPRDRAQRTVAELVLAVAQEREVALGEPLEERPALGQQMALARRRPV